VAEGCPVDAAARAAVLEAHLVREARHARRWNLGWTIGYGLAAAAQGGVAAARWARGGDPDRTGTAGLWIGAVSATLGALAHGLLPLEILRPVPAADPCERLAAAQRAVEGTGRAERAAFYLGHVVDLALSSAGLIVLGVGFHAWREGGRSFALGYAVGLADIYTQPRASWHVRIVAEPEVHGLAVAGTF